MKPLVGVWVHQVPELGNVVYVMPGFLSVVGCRIIPQEGGPLGIQEGRVMWSPVFEIISDFDGSTEFFLHGRGREGNCVYPGSVTGTIEKSCDVISLEVEKKNKRQDKSGLPFQELGGSDRLNLLELVTGHVGLNLPEPLSINIVLTAKEDEGMLLERRTMLLKMHKFDGIDFEHSYTGMGIASGYGFRGPGFVPGSLHVISDDHLAFVWHETKNVFTLKRLNLEEVLKKGLRVCVPPLPPTKNFMYSGMSYTNAYTES